MTRFAREALKMRIVNFYGNVANSRKNSAVKHFQAKQIPKSTIYLVIRTYLRIKMTQNLSKSGRTKNWAKKLLSA